AAEHFEIAQHGYELQMLYGMGDAEKQVLVDRGHRLRIYMPYGELIPGMAYLVRRLLENTSNDSFLRASFAEQVAPEILLMNPIDELARSTPPEEEIAGGFQNEPPIDFSKEANRQAMSAALAEVKSKLGAHYPLVIGGQPVDTRQHDASYNPADKRQVVVKDAELARKLTQNPDNFVILTDDEGVIVDINAYGSRVLDWPVQEIRGHTLTMLEPSGPLNWLSSVQGPGQHRETRFRTRGGATIEVLVSGYPVCWNDGVRCILVAKNVQELVFLRTEVQRLQEQVEQLQELESVGKLAGGIAHDVNNILTAIQGHASLLAHKGSTDASIQQPVEVIRQAVHRGQELTAQLLGTARRENERRSSLNVHDTIEEVLALLSGDRTNGIQITREFEARDSWIKGNARQLHQVLLNLIVNACDAMPEGGTVTIATVSHVQGDLTGLQAFPLQGHPFLEIRVTDSGCGIPDELRQAVFEPFFSTKPSTKGSGMGLAIVKEIVEAHGGRITMSSEVNHGTSFHLYFPQDQQTQSDLIHLPTVLGRPNPRILVVDDEPLVAETTVEMLRLFECEPRVVPSGEEAIERYREHPDEIDLIVLDLSMPSMSGEDCFQGLRAINPSVKVVFTSGAEKFFSVQQLIDDGLAGFVQKPFDVEDLSQALKKVCANDRENAPYALSGMREGI
ncbi:MAG: proline dehydrogenase family protein, partial [Nitrospinae bacterium]|nr:proline dehydrogenase family protein [Nitrospinota bacterium]